MTRSEYNEVRAIEKSIRQFDRPSYGTTLTIRTDASPDYKARLHRYYTALGFHPASVRVDRAWYDDRERIIYIYGLDFEGRDGKRESWEVLYTAEEKARFAAALN